MTKYRSDLEYNDNIPSDIDVTRDELLCTATRSECQMLSIASISYGNVIFRSNSSTYFCIIKNNNTHIFTVHAIIPLSDHMFHKAEVSDIFVNSIDANYIVFVYHSSQTNTTFRSHENNKTIEHMKKLSTNSMTTGPSKSTQR